MITIPEQLKQKGIRFVLVEPRGKKPFQKEWQNKNISYDNWELLDHLSNNGNYGVLGGGDINGKSLIIVDFDNEFIQNILLKDLPETFTVKTGSGLFHLYFFTDLNPESYKAFDEEMNTLFDVQGMSKQVIGANSQHPNGNYYQVVKDIPITFIDYAELKAKLMVFDRRPKKTSEVKNNQIKERKEYSKIAGDDFLDRVKDKVSMEQALNYCGIDTTQNPTACPFHSSKGGHCLGFNKVTSHCFHCLQSFNVFSLIKEYEKCSFKEALDILAGLAGLKDEFIESKKNYAKTMRQLESDALTKKIEEEKAKQAKKREGKINIPGDDGKIIRMDGSIYDPIEDMVRRRMMRLKTTRGTTLGKEDDSYKIKIEETK